MRIILLSLLIVSFAGPLVTCKPIPIDDEQAVREAADQFYSALNALFKGEVDPMKEVWSHKDDVTYMGPAGGFQIGWDQILPEWEASAALKLGGEIKPVDVHIQVGQSIAIVQNYEAGENIGEDGAPINVSIRATNIFRKENGKWKMISHHTDLLSYLAN